MLGFKSIIFNEMMNKIGNIEGKKVVDYGCGEGWLTKVLANKGAEVWAFDISDEALRKTRNLLKSLKLEERVHVDQMPAEDLNYDSNMFDLIVGNAILHHTDLRASLKEVRRVLKDGGRAYFLEPLGHNPLLNFYRRITPNLRSEDEVPLCFEQLSIIKRYFARFEHEEYYLFSLFAVLWHFIGFDNLMLKTRDSLHKTDKIILNLLPFLRKYCWYSILTFEK